MQFTNISVKVLINVCVYRYPFGFLESWLSHIYQHTIARVFGLGEKVGGGHGKEKEQFCKEN